LEHKPPTWKDLKRVLDELDRNDLLGLVRDLHAASKENRTFLNARFGLSDAPLAPYKAVISRWVSPHFRGDQTLSVTKAKKAISDYKKAVGDPEGLAELATFYCECSAWYLGDIYGGDETYCGALVRVFDQALEAVQSLHPEQQRLFVGRLEAVRRRARKLGWSLDFHLDDLMDQYGFELD